MQLRYTILFVADVPAALSFYERAFGLTRAMLHESGSYGELATGSTKLAFTAVSLMKELGKSPGTPDPKHPTFEIGFETEDVAAAYAKALAAGAKSVQKPTDMPWGQTTAYVTDCHGFLVELCTAVRHP